MSFWKRVLLLLTIGCPSAAAAVDPVPERGKSACLLAEMCRYRDRATSLELKVDAALLPVEVRFRDTADLVEKPLRSMAQGCRALAEAAFERK